MATPESTFIFTPVLIVQEHKSTPVKRFPEVAKIPIFVKSGTELQDVPLKVVVTTGFIITLLDIPEGHDPLETIKV